MISETIKTDNCNVETCPWCGEKIHGDNLLLGYEFDTENYGDYVVYFGCCLCIAKPLEGFSVPDGFINFHQDEEAFNAVQEYRKKLLEALKGNEDESNEK